MYNGWDVGMTYDGAHNGKECSHNRNRDYVHSIVNGYMQGTDSSGWNAYGREYLISTDIYAFSLY
jgi:hypothetical protein